MLVIIRGPSASRDHGDGIGGIVLGTLGAGPVVIDVGIQGGRPLSGNH